MLGKHLLGLYEKALPDDMSLPEKFGSAADMGFDYLEISIDESDKRISRLWLPEEELDALAAGIRRSGLHARSLCLSAHRRFPLGSADARTRRAALEIMRRAVRFSEALGIRMIQLAGYDVYYEPSTEESRRLFVCGLREACREAEAHQVMLAMEIMDTELLCSISRFMKLKEEVRAPWFTVYPDMGNLSAWDRNDVLKELSLGIDEITAMHVKEALPESAGPDRFKRIPFGTGCVDFEGIFAHMEKLGYTGPYTIEMWDDGTGRSKEAITKAKNFISDRFDSAMSRMSLE